MELSSLKNKKFQELPSSKSNKTHPEKMSYILGNETFSLKLKKTSYISAGNFTVPS